MTVKQLRDQIKPIIDTFHSLSVKVDGIYVNKQLRRVQSQPFDVALPADNLLGCHAEVYSPAVDDGYYVAVRPLTPGNHTIQFHAEGKDPLGNDFIEDVTYNLTVVPISLK
jgi:hypothetical protein